MKILEGIKNKQHTKWNEKEISTGALQINSKKMDRKKISTKEKPRKKKQIKRKKRYVG